MPHQFDFSESSQGVNWFDGILLQFGTQVLPTVFTSGGAQVITVPFRDSAGDLQTLQYGLSSTFDLFQITPGVPPLEFPALGQSEPLSAEAAASLGRIFALQGRLETPLNENASPDGAAFIRFDGLAPVNFLDFTAPATVLADFTEALDWVLAQESAVLARVYQEQQDLVAQSLQTVSQVYGQTWTSGNAGAPELVLRYTPDAQTALLIGALFFDGDTTDDDPRDLVLTQLSDIGFGAEPVVITLSEEDDIATQSGGLSIADLTMRMLGGDDSLVLQNAPRPGPNDPPLPAVLDIDAGAGDDTVFAALNPDGQATLSGGTGDDDLTFVEFVGGTARAVLLGGDGEDTLTGGQRSVNEMDGGAEDDVLRGGDLDDRLEGGAGDDTLDGGAGDDTLSGGTGDDTLRGFFGDDTVFAGAGADTVRSELGQDLVFLNQGDDLFVDGQASAQNGADTVFAGFGDDTIEGGAGNDVYHGEWGADSIFAASGDDLVFGGDQFDTIAAGEGADTVWGGNGRDLVFLGSGDDLFNDNGQGGDLGRDTVFGGAGDDTIEGGNGSDVFYGEDGNDVINARLGDDLVFGGAGADRIAAGEGRDTVFGGNGPDLVFLGSGDDLFNDDGQAGPLGNDTVFAGLGNDSVQGGNGDDVFYGEDGNDVINARLGNDSVYGGANFDTIDAGDGNDLVFGGLGRDLVLLGAGDDRYVDTDQAGALGQDTVTGGAGADVFVFGTAPSADVITDFEIGVDSLELATALGGGRSAAQIASDGQVTAQGVLLDFGGGNTLLLEGLGSTAGLGQDILLV